MAKLANTALLVLQVAAAMADSGTTTAEEYTTSYTTTYASPSPWKPGMATTSTPTGQVTTMAMVTTNTVLAHTSESSVSSMGQPPAPASSLASATTVSPAFPSSPYSTHFEDVMGKFSLISLDPKLSEEEVKYLSTRKLNANKQLQDWVEGVFGQELKDKLHASNSPTLGFATSGGGVRSLLTSAGVLESLSQPDTPSSPNLYDAMTVFSSVSTTSWLPFIMIRDGYNLREYVDRVLKPQLKKGLLPFIDTLPASQKQRIRQDLQSRGQNIDIKSSMSSADTWSRVLAYKLLSGPKGQDNINHMQLVDITLSSLVTKYNYPSAGQPLPILNMLAMTADACMPIENEMPFEVTPFRSGTWAAEDNFSPLMFKTRYLDTQMNKAVVGWDNVGLLTGISSFSMNMVNCQTNHKSSPETYRAWVDEHTDVTTPPYARIHNPFFMQKAPLLNQSHYVKEPSLRLVDGSESNHGIPLLPLLHPERYVDVIIAVDSTGGRNNYPDGSQMLAAAKLASGLRSYKERIPEMPITTDMWNYQMPDRKAIVFGCYEPNTTTIIYLPNAGMGGPDSNAPETKWNYSKTETTNMFENGILVGNQGNKKEWSKCMGCFILKKTALVFDDKCGQCWNDFCYKKLDYSKQVGPDFEVWKQPPRSFSRVEAIPTLDNAASWNKPTVVALALVATAAWSLL